MALTRTELLKYLYSLGACNEALIWINQTPGEPEDLWAACQRGDWMIWLLRGVDYDEWTMLHIACDCAESVLSIYEQAHPNDPRPRDCIAVARRYANGVATYDELIAASNAAKAAAWDAVNDSAYAAARAAIWATSKTTADTAANDAAWAAACAAACATSGDVVRTASWATSSDEAWAAAMSRLADMVRIRVSWMDVEQAIECWTKAELIVRGKKR